MQYQSIDRLTRNKRINTRAHSMKKKLLSLESHLINTERKLKEVNEKYLGLIKNTTDIIYTHDTRGNFLSVNKAAQNVYGYANDEFRNLNISQIVDEKYLPLAFENINKKVKGIKKSPPQEYLTYTKNGKHVWVEANTHPVGEEGNMYVQGIARDISTRKKIEKALIESEKELKSKINYLNALIENMNELFYTYDKDARITFVNNKCKEITGHNPDQIVGRNLLHFVPEHYKEIVKKGIQDRLKKGVPASYETPILHKNGSLRIIKLNASPIIELGEITGGMVLAEDITSRKQAEYDLQQSREWFFKAFNASPSLMVILDIKTLKIMDANKSFLDTLGYSRRDVIGKTLSDLRFWMDEKDNNQLRGNFRNLEAVFLDKAENARVGLFSSEAISIRKNKLILLLINDITERKQMEKEITRLDRLNMVGEMAAGMGHEIRNPMTAVRGFLQLLSKKKDCSQYRDFFELMINELDRMNLIISEFLSLAKNKLVELKLQNLNSIIVAIIPLVQADAIIYDKAVGLELGQIPDLPLDEKEIRQLILNLSRNGLEAMPSGGNLTVKTYHEGSEIVLAVQDQGPEIPNEVFDKMGTPFFTTKENGTGLGLAVCHSIAARHGAIIKVSTGPQGTTVYVCFKK
ncbi:MAG: PAS domain S-box protein [Bacillota bacterium]